MNNEWPQIKCNSWFTHLLHQRLLTINQTFTSVRHVSVYIVSHLSKSCFTDFPSCWCALRVCHEQSLLIIPTPNEYRVILEGGKSIASPRLMTLTYANWSQKLCQWNQIGGVGQSYFDWNTTSADEPWLMKMSSLKTSINNYWFA